MSSTSPLTPFLRLGKDSILYELRFRSLFDNGRALAFPCDANGIVNLSELSAQAQKNYLQARQVIGKDWATPSVQVRADH